MKLLARHYAVLERLFESEIKVQGKGKSKVFRELADGGMIRTETITLGGRFPMKVTEWVLTLAGNMAYCEWAAKRSLAVPRPRQE